MIRASDTRRCSEDVVRTGPAAYTLGPHHVTGIALALGSALSWGCGDFLSGLMSRRLPLLTVLLLSQAAGVPLMAVLALLRGVPADWSFAPIAALAGMTGLLGLASLFRGMSLGAISIVAPISATGAALPVAVGLFTGEQPTPLQGLGVLFALAGVVLASRPVEDDTPVSETTTPARKNVLAAGAGFGLLAALGFGLFYLVLRAASAASGEDPFWPVLIARTVASSFLVGVCLLRRHAVRVSAASGGTLALAGALDVSANALYAAASTSGIGPLAAVLSSLFPVITVALARVFLQERLSGTQAAGVVSALLGVGLIAWR